MGRKKGLKMQCFTSYCVCPDCGKTFPIPRLPRQARERNHTKDLWCPYCKETKHMLEIRYGDYYKNGNGELIDNV